MKQKITDGMAVVAIDGVHIGTVDDIEDGRIRLKKHGSIWKNKKHHHFLNMGFVDHVTQDVVHLSTTSDIVATMEEATSDEPLEL